MIRHFGLLFNNLEWILLLLFLLIRWRHLQTSLSLALAHDRSIIHFAIIDDLDTAVLLFFYIFE